jgi:hypothetical protein
MKKYLTSILIVTLIVTILTACTGEETPTEDVDVLTTSAVGTMVASFFDTQTAMYTPPVPTSTATYTPFPSPTIIYPTATLGPTLTPTLIYYSATPGTITPTGTLPTPTVNSASLAVGCNNLAFIRDVSVPAGTVLEKGREFTKTWKVQNTGTCDWMYQYTLVPVGGETFGGVNTKIQKRVSVWDWSEITVDLVAPKKPGTYTGYWRLSNGQNLFGATLTVSFVVKDVLPTPVPPTATLSPTTGPTATPTLSPTAGPAATPTFTYTPTPTQVSTQTPTPTPTSTP